MSLATVVAGSSVWVNEFSPDKVMPQSDNLYVGTTAGQTRYAYVAFPTAWAPGSTIMTAKLQLRAGRVWPAATYTLKVRTVTAPWSNSISWANRPTVGVTELTFTKTNPQGLVWEADVTTLIQQVAAGAPWYGLRLETTPFALSTTFQSNLGLYPPQLIVNSTKPPEQPSSLRPGMSVGAAISQQYPPLTYVFKDLGGNMDQVAHQIQIADSKAKLVANTPDWDSGEVATTIPLFDTSLTYSTATPTTTWGGLANLSTRYWRVRAKDGDGLWSVWSTEATMLRNTYGVLAWSPSAPTAITEGSPSFSWTLTGKTQTFYQLVLTSPDSPTQEPLYDTGRQYSTNQTVNIPFGIVKRADWRYKVTLRVWDTVNREAIPGDPGYLELSTGDLPVNFNASVPSPTGLAMTGDLLLPVANLSWTQSTPPAYYQLLRSEDGGNSYVYVKEAPAASLNVGGTNYEWDDNQAPTNKNIKIRVVAVDSSGVQSAGPIADGRIRRVAPVLFAPDSTLPVIFLNPERSFTFGDIQGVHEPIAGDPVLVTQRLGHHKGSMSGRVTSDLGIDAEEQFQNFLKHREMSGAPVLVGIANRTFKAFAYNFQYDIITNSEGISYWCSYDWMEVS